MDMVKTKLGFALPLILIVLALVVIVGGAGVYYFKYLAPKTTVTSVVTPPVANVASVKLTLTVDSPTDGTLATNNSVTVRGKTKPNVSVVIFTDKDSVAVQSDNSGNFNGSVSLENGINSLTVTAFDDDGTELSSSMDIVYDNAT